MKVFYCANCGIKLDGGAYMCCDNYLQVNFFENNALNRFCSTECACEYMSVREVDLEELPVDENEEEEEKEY